MRFVLQRVKHASVKVDGELIGFTKPVAKTICEEFGIDMEDDAWKD